MHAYLSRLPLARHWCSQASGAELWQAVPAAPRQPLRGLRRRPRRQGHGGAGRRARIQRRAERDKQEAEAIAGGASRTTTRGEYGCVPIWTLRCSKCSTDKRASNVEGVVSLGNVAGRPHWVRLRPASASSSAVVAAAVRARHLHARFKGLRGRRRQGFNRKVPRDVFWWKGGVRGTIAPI